MTEKMSAFLVDVAENPDQLAELMSNPERELGRAGLTDAQKAAVLSRDSRKVRAALGSPALSANDDVLEVPPPPPPPPTPPPAPRPPTRRKPTRRKPPAKKRPKRPTRKPSKRRPARKKGPSRRSRKGPARKKR